MWRLSSTDLAEIARNSVLQSSFEPCVKAAWLGPNYRLAGVAGNDIRKTNLPNLRVQYRHAMLHEEREHILTGSAPGPCPLVFVADAPHTISIAEIARHHAEASRHVAVPRGSWIPPASPIMRARPLGQSRAQHGHVHAGRQPSAAWRQGAERVRARRRVRLFGGDGGSSLAIAASVLVAGIAIGLAISRRR